MGSIISSIGDTVFALSSALKALTTLSSQWQTLLGRIAADPGIPVPDPTSSYWQDNPPFADLVSIQSPLPSTADIVIVGSGITSAAIAKSLLELSSSRAPRIVVCEARQLCSGATGRNGGHIKCAPYEMFASFRRKRGPQRAREIVRLQRRHLDVLLQVGAAVVEAEAREVETVDLYLEKEDFERAKREVDEMGEWLPEEKCVVWEAEEARKEFGVNSTIVGAVSFRAGALWPYRLVTGVWKDLLERFPTLTISTSTAVQAVSLSSSTSHPYTVKTARGAIQARHVVHATNAHASHLNPSLRKCITGALAHMSAQKAGSEFPPSHGKRSWSIIYSPGFDYVTQRPDGDDGSPGDLMVGGGFFRSREEGLDQIGVYDDSRVDCLPSMHIRGTMGAVFEPRWGDSSVRKAWTGIISFTGDLIPFVSRIPTSNPPKPKETGLEGAGEWIAAGFNGEGMVWAWLCGTALAIMVLGKEDEELEEGVGRPGGRLEEWFPADEFKIDAARLRRADLKNLAAEAGR